MIKTDSNLGGMFMKKSIISGIRLAIKALLCISLIVSVGLLLNYIRNLNPTADGFDVTNSIARMIHGDDYWTWESLTTGVSTAWSLFAALFCVDKIFDAVFQKSSK